VCPLLLHVTASPCTAAAAAPLVCCYQPVHCHHVGDVAAVLLLQFLQALMRHWCCCCPACLCVSCIALTLQFGLSITLARFLRLAQ
jgi:hypothetical protein